MLASSMQRWSLLRARSAVRVRRAQPGEPRLGDRGRAARSAKEPSRTMAKFCFVIHPVSFEDVVRYEPGAAGKGRPIVAKILEWMPAYAAAHLTGIRSPDGRETEGWFVAAPLLPEQMLELPREAVYERILRAIAIGAELGAEIAGLG